MGVQIYQGLSTVPHALQEHHLFSAARFSLLGGAAERSARSQFRVPTTTRTKQSLSTLEGRESSPSAHWSLSGGEEWRTKTSRQNNGRTHPKALLQACTEKSGEGRNDDVPRGCPEHNDRPLHLSLEAPAAVTEDKASVLFMELQRTFHGGHDGTACLAAEPQRHQHHRYSRDTLGFLQ